jgi:hypothetical protein
LYPYLESALALDSKFGSHLRDTICRIDGPEGGLVAVEEVLAAKIEVGKIEMRVLDLPRINVDPKSWSAEPLAPICLFTNHVTFWTINIERSTARANATPTNPNNSRNGRL